MTLHAPTARTSPRSEPTSNNSRRTGRTRDRGLPHEMGDPSPSVSTLVLSRHWHDTSSEISFVIRSLAGAASRLGRITICTPGAPGPASPDGGFDVIAIGTGITTPWPAPDVVAWPVAAEPISVIIVDEMDDSCRAMLRHHCANRGIYDVADRSQQAGGAPDVT